MTQTFEAKLFDALNSADLDKINQLVHVEHRTESEVVSYNHTFDFAIDIPMWDEEDRSWSEQTINVYRMANISTEYAEDSIPDRNISTPYTVIDDLGDVFVDEDVPMWGLKRYDNLNKLPIFDKLAKQVQMERFL